MRSALRHASGIVVGGREATPTTAEDKLFFILFHFRIYAYPGRAGTVLRSNPSQLADPLPDPEEKAQNRATSGECVGVEPSIGSIEAHYIVRDIYRNHREMSEDLPIETVCDLLNLRLHCALAA